MSNYEYEPSGLRTTQPPAAGPSPPLRDRVGAIPYALRDDTLMIAVADPANLHGIDELRLATRHPVELAVAAREDILGAVRRLVRTSEAFGARLAVDDFEVEVEEDDQT